MPVLMVIISPQEYVDKIQKILDYRVRQRKEAGYMKKILYIGVTVIVIAGLSIAGCAQKAAPVATSQEAISQSKTLATAQEQAKYLISQANSFINSKKFQDAITTAQYVLSNLDKNSLDAKSLLEKAKAELAKAAQSAVTDVKKKLGTLGQ